MTTLAQIEQAVVTLTDDDFQRLYHWMRELDHQKWDQQIEDDSKNGALDWLANQAIEEYRQGRTQRL
ncbi:MAG: hypothetical protein GY797_37465 [Deltaproteobacteria bacterium]|nr:hypothetical protein [Deltaproteobacteria bacterium]